MHGLAHYADRLGMAPEDQPTRKFAKRFWSNLSKTGRVNELKLGLSLYFMNGFGEGVKTALKMKDVGLGMVKTRRMNPMEIVGGHGVKDRTGFQAILQKAREIELAKAARFEG
jgi:quinone-modifying oxidoreductase subunit QmoC